MLGLTFRVYILIILSVEHTLLSFNLGEKSVCICFVFIFFFGAGGFLGGGGGGGGGVGGLCFFLHFGLDRGTINFLGGVFGRGYTTLTTLIFGFYSLMKSALEIL